MEGHPKLLSELQKAEEVSKLSTWTHNGPELVPGGAAFLASSTASLLFVKGFLNALLRVFIHQEQQLNFTVHICSSI